MARDVVLSPSRVMMSARSTPNLQQAPPSQQQHQQQPDAAVAVRGENKTSIYSYLHNQSGLNFAPVVQQQTQGDTGSPPPAPPVRDPSSLKCVKYGPGHEKFPSWPVSAAADTPQSMRSAPGGGSHRSKSWTDHTNYPKEKGITYTRPYMKRPNPAFTQQQLKTVMERCEKIPAETFESRPEIVEDSQGRLYLPRVDREGKALGDTEYMVPSPPERDIISKPQLTQADLEEYARSYQDPPQLTRVDLEEYARSYQDPKPQATHLTQADLEEYSRTYDALKPQHQQQQSYAQSEGYHSYVSSTDSITTTPFLDRLRRDSEATTRPGAAPETSWDEHPERERDGSHAGRDSVVTTSSGSASSSETLKWHGSLSDVSVASSSCTHHGSASSSSRQLIAHSARVQTPQRHHSESVLYLGGGNTTQGNGWQAQVQRNNHHNKLRLFPVNTYTVQPIEQQSSSHRYVNEQQNLTRLLSFWKRLHGVLLNMCLKSNHFKVVILYCTIQSRTFCLKKCERTSDSCAFLISMCLIKYVLNFSIFGVSVTTLLDILIVGLPRISIQMLLRLIHVLTNRLIPMSLLPPTLSVAERINELERQQTRYTYLDPDKRHRVSDPTLKAIQKKALLSFYERHHSATARSQTWRSEPQLAQPTSVAPCPQSPPPQPPPRPRASQSSRRASSASDYAGGSWTAVNKENFNSESGSIRDGPRHQHSSSCGSLSTDLLGPLIVGPSISVDDWVPERPPKKPHLRAAFPPPVPERLPSPDLPPPSPPPVLEDEVFASDEPLPPPPPELHSPDRTVVSESHEERTSSPPKQLSQNISSLQRHQDTTVRNLESSSDRSPENGSPVQNESAAQRHGENSVTSPQRQSGNLTQRHPENMTSPQGPSETNVPQISAANNLLSSRHVDGSNQKVQDKYCKNSSLADSNHTLQRQTENGISSQRYPERGLSLPRNTEDCVVPHKRLENIITSQRHLEHSNVTQRHRESATTQKHVGKSNQNQGSVSNEITLQRYHQNGSSLRHLENGTGSQKQAENGNITSRLTDSMNVTQRSIDTNVSMTRHTSILEQMKLQEKPPDSVRITDRMGFRNGEVVLPSKLRLQNFPTAVSNGAGNMPEEPSRTSTSPQMVKQENSVSGKLEQTEGRDRDPRISPSSPTAVSSEGITNDPQHVDETEQKIQEPPAPVTRLAMRCQS
ncbi:hypothetical protein B7P43_G10424 [Cryptotermes secundus]|uniref:Uncharacterized protein n=1 Tax=Cryptotermes secundus TaxID=105785 RepID=A0A2J7PHI1_9NEOP|nr:hypothetical protein B7P43_G10424 [Cryptotermes secundus]